MSKPYVPQSAYVPGQAAMQDQIDALERRLAECEKILEALRTMPSAHLVRVSDV